MRIRVQALLPLAVALMLGAPSLALAKNGRPNPKSDIFPTLRVGRWIRLDGMLMKDRTVQCTELKVLAGDFIDDDWSITGQVEGVEMNGRRFRIGDITVHVAETAELEDGHGHGQIKSFAEIKPGMIIEVDGTYLKDRTFLAHDVDDESDEIRIPRGERHLRLIGKIEQSDPGRRRIQAMGMVFIITEKTQVKSMIR